MFHIRSALLGFSALAVIATAGIAQTGKVAQPGRKQQVARARMAKQAIVARNLTRGLFRGIQLSDVEKARVTSVREAYKPKVQALRQTLLADRQVLRAIRERGDTAALRIQRQRLLTAEREQARNLVAAMRTDLRAALAAENQAKFDANAARMRDRLADRADSVGKRLRNPGVPKVGRRPGA